MTQPTTPAPFAGASDLQTFLGGDVDTDRANLMLRIASNAMRREMQQTIDLVTNDVVTLDGPYSITADVFVRELPVVVVHLVEVKGIDGTFSSLTEGVDYEWSADGTFTRLACSGYGWPTLAQSIRITYDHGYATIPQDLADVAISAAGRLYDNPLGLSGENIGNYSFRGNRQGGVDFTDIEQDVLDSYCNGRVG